MTAEQLGPRRAVLGGSQIAAAAGIDPYCSPIRLWLEMTGRIERAQTEAMRLGTLMEPVVFAALNERGIPAVRARGELLRRDDTPWLVGHPDGYAEGSVVEAKCTSHTADAVRPAHAAQVQTYLWLSGRTDALVAYLGGMRLDVYPVARSDGQMEALLELAAAFMACVQQDRQPPVTGNPDDRDALLLAHPTARRTAGVRETRGVREARRELHALLGAEKARKQRIEHLRALIAEHMGDAELLLGRDGEPVATWKAVTSHRLDTKALRAARPDIYTEYATETTTRRLALT